MQPQVAIGLLGTTLDAGFSTSRWERWRPTVSMFQQDDLLIARFELLHPPQAERLADQVVEDIRAVSPRSEVRLHPIDFEDAWDFERVYASLLDFCRRYPFDAEREDYLVHITTGTHVAQICLYLLTEARYLPARLLQTSPSVRERSDEGGVGGSCRIIDLDLSKYDQIWARFQQEREEGLSVLKSGIATRNASFNAMIAEIETVAQASRAPILLTGPTGAGKTQLARRIVALRRARRLVGGELVEVNCATLRGDQAMSALFGHTKGAFTGAVRERPGLLKSADGGCLFLDEIGELGLDEQAMLLRAIETGCFLPVGADREVKSDFQLIAGTNRDLRADISEGQFREDLLARLNLWEFELPGLTERLEDIEPNLDYELDNYALEHGSRVTFNKEARRAFLRFATSREASWRGNFRDLNAAVTRMATLAPGGRINVATVETEIARLRRSWQGRHSEEHGLARLRVLLGDEGLADLDRFDRVQLADVVAVCMRSNSLSDAGRELFAVSRTRRKTVNDADRLRKYLARFELEWSQVVGEPR